MFARAETIYQIAGKKIAFKDYKGLLINKACNKSCVALKKIKEVTRIKENYNENEIAVSLGSYICKKKLKSLSVLGQDSFGNMKDFCFFKKDKSFIEMSSLSRYFNKKKESN